MPAAVGVDIGCGMIAVRTQFRAHELPVERKPLREAIEAVVPVSMTGTPLANAGTGHRLASRGNASHQRSRLRWV